MAQSKSTPTVDNVSQSICFSDGSNENDSHPSVTTTGNDPLFPSVIDGVSSIPKNTNPHLSSKSSPSNNQDIAVTNIATTNLVDNDSSTVDNQSQLSAQSLVHSVAATVKENFCHSSQHRRGSKTGSSVHSCINSILHGGINSSQSPLSQVSLCNPLSCILIPVVHWTMPLPPAANTAQAPGAPACIVDPSSFPACHNPSVAFGSTNTDSLMSHTASHNNPKDPISNSPPHASESPHTAVHIEPSAVSTLSTFRGKPVNPAPTLGLEPPPSGPPSGGTGHLQDVQTVQSWGPVP